MMTVLLVTVALLLIAFIGFLIGIRVRFGGN